MYLHVLTKGPASEYIDQGSRGVFCKNDKMCKARLICDSGRSCRSKAKPPAKAPLTAAEAVPLIEEHMNVIKQALLRSNPHLESPTNGVQVEVGETVLVLGRTLSPCGTPFIQVKVCNKQGYIRQAYCEAV